jgi:hypothetical protein
MKDKDQYETAAEKLLEKFKKDPQYELNLEFGKLLMKHINDFTPEERARYEELKIILHNGTSRQAKIS